MKILVVGFVLIFLVALIFSSCSFAYTLPPVVLPSPKLERVATVPNPQSDDIETLDKELRAYNFEKDLPI